ncbi:hypothetical protein OJAV_G00176430 [Oryzias javanicus]|uniref:Uncharacterized protein n=1 Tax=Oryzias javanicus TaxID=123683 RepID=A0A437CH00_ORYJA|nr:hypothetical protein OJAV_G00176430 [Oryzias javanicus]
MSGSHTGCLTTVPPITPQFSWRSRKPTVSEKKKNHSPARRVFLMKEAPADSTVIGEVGKWVRVDPFTAPRRAPVLRDSPIRFLRLIRFPGNS